MQVETQAGSRGLGVKVGGRIENCFLGNSICLCLHVFDSTFACVIEELSGT